MKRILSLTLAVLLCCLAVAVLPGATVAAEQGAVVPGTLTDEVGRETQELTLADGTATGVRWTQITLDGYYGSKIVNVAEFSLSNTHLSLEVINSGKYLVSTDKTSEAAAAYNRSHEGQTVLAAINGDLWMTKVHSSAAITTKTLQTTRGVLIVDGEIWASQQLDAENRDATNAEKNAPAGDKAAFGVTSANQPLVGSPDIRIAIRVNGKTLQADGINRLPARDSLIVYNARLNDSNYALNDAYEVELEMEDDAFRAGGTLTGKVKAIYPKNSATRPALSARTVVLTARGNKVSQLESNFRVGDTVTFETSLTDRWGNTELWQTVQEAIGGHMQVLVDGKQGVANGSTAEYPTTLIGYRDDGSVMLCTVTSTAEKKYAGLKFAHAYKFCRELGYNSVFYLDGGGSSTFVSLEEGSYTVRNNCSDGAPRRVINSVGVVWNDTPVCAKQGSLSYIDIPVDLSSIPPTHMDGALLADVVGSPNAVTLRYDETERALAVTTSSATNDPYALLSFSALAPIRAEDAPYMVFKVKSDYDKATTFKLYYAAGSVGGATEQCTRVFQIKPGDEWQYIVVDMSKANKWSGTVNNIRLDVIDGMTVPANVTVYIGAIVLCPSVEEADAVEAGWLPEGCITDYLAYKESLRPKETETETEPVTEPETTVTESETVVTDTATEPETATKPATESASEPGTSASVPVTDSATVPATTATAEGGGCASALTGGMAGISLLGLLTAVSVCAVRRRRA